MIKTVLKLAVVALLANATWHVFSAYSPHFKFRDVVEYAAHYGGDEPADTLRERVMDLAGRFNVPITADDVSVSRDSEKRTIVHLSYVKRIELVPGFSYPWTFSINVDTYSIPPPTEGR